MRTLSEYQRHRLLVTRYLRQPGYVRWQDGTENLRTAPETHGFGRLRMAEKLEAEADQIGSKRVTDLQILQDLHDSQINGAISRQR